jgi:pseudouridine-5'-phosphate glycosidase/pseudouridine kinase
MATGWCKARGIFSNNFLNSSYLKKTVARSISNVGLVKPAITIRRLHKSLISNILRLIPVRRNSDWCVIHPEVREAISSGQAVVALETAIVTHGMPYPHNYEVALMVEGVIRKNKAVPATIGVIEGKVHVGLTSRELALLADKTLGKLKISKRDFPFALSQKCSGGTTVSGTMLVAHKVGIPIFVTGGVGGVHRGGETSMDVSADLMELGRTPVAVVCAGAKSILDIGRTLEVLETQGVCVMTFGEDIEFPAFFTRSSGYQSPYRVADIEDCAQLINQSLDFTSGSGVLVSVPIPESAAAIGSEIEAAIQKAVQEAELAHVRGRDVTPFILSRVNDVTEGKSLQANIALVKNNAAVGSRVAVRLAHLRRLRSGGGVSGAPCPHTPPSSSGAKAVPITHSMPSSRAGIHNQKNSHPVVVGGAVFDLTAKLKYPELHRDGTNPGTVSSSLGGVGRNLVEVMGKLDMEPFFVTAVGKDDQGKAVVQHMEELGLSVQGVHVLQQIPTASYCIVLDHKGEMFCGIGDMDCMDHVTPSLVMEHADTIRSSPLVVVEANMSVETIHSVCMLCNEVNVPVLYEPTAVQKACRVVTAGVHSLVKYATPNLAELVAIYKGIVHSGKIDIEDVHDLTREEKLSRCLQHIPAVVNHIPNLYIKLGCDGVVVAQKDASTRKGYSVWHYQAASDHLLPVNVVSVSGAGDRLA